MAVKFVIKKFYKNRTSEYFQAESLIEDLFSNNIYLAWCFDKYEDAENKISSLKGVFQIEKIFFS